MLIWANGLTKLSQAGNMNRDVKRERELAEMMRSHVTATGDRCLHQNPLKLCR